MSFNSLHESSKSNQNMAPYATGTEHASAVLHQALCERLMKALVVLDYERPSDCTKYNKKENTI